MVKGERQSGQQTPESKGYVFGPTPASLPELSDGNVPGMPVHEGGDSQNRITTTIEMQLARHFSEIEPLTPGEVTQLSDDHREAVQPTFVSDTTIE